MTDNQLMSARHLVIAMEHRFGRTEAGGVVTDNMYPRPFWNRYRERFERVTIVARVHEGSGGDPQWQAVEGNGVDIYPLPAFIGPGQFVSVVRRVGKDLRSLVAWHPNACYLLRVPGTIGTMLARRLRHADMPYGVEVVGDPYDVFAPNAVRHPLRPVWRMLGTAALRRICRDARAAIYVTERALQKRYPTGGASFSASDVELGSIAFAACPRDYRELSASAPVVVTVGTLDQPYKGTKVLLDALAMIRQQGVDVYTVIVGQGRLRDEFEQHASDLGIADVVEFVGGVPAGDAVRRQLDRATLFVLPSLVEGLPRALVEAMARGLPAVASDIGGIPELLPAECLVPPGDVLALAMSIRRFVEEPELAARCSCENLQRARQFDENRLQAVRREFWEVLCDNGHAGERST